MTPARAVGSAYLADGTTGLWRITLANGSGHALVAPERAELRGLDGWQRVGDGMLGVRNGTRTQRIPWIVPRNAAPATRADKPVEGRPAWDEPSLGTVIGTRFWSNANSQWSRFDDKLHALPGVMLQASLLDPLALPSGAVTAAGG
ncbi:MAG TPA: hypothetical protein VIM06_05335 [Rhodanobacter sp.]